VSDMSDMEKAVQGGAEFTAAQQKKAAEDAAAEQARRAALPQTPCDTSDAGIRSRGGYMLMDPQWVAGGPWNGLPASEMQGEMNRKFDIVERMNSGTVFGFTHEGKTNPADDLDAFAADLAGWFPASKAGRTNLQMREGTARLDFSVQTGNELAACVADPQFWVASIADAE
jgi:hypothetical protein